MGNALLTPSLVAAEWAAYLEENIKAVQSVNGDYQTFLSDNTTGISMRFVKQFDVQVDAAPSQVDFVMVPALLRSPVLPPLEVVKRRAYFDD